MLWQLGMGWAVQQSWQVAPCGCCGVQVSAYLQAPQLASVCTSQPSTNFCRAVLLQGSPSHVQSLTPVLCCSALAALEAEVAAKKADFEKNQPLIEQHHKKVSRVTEEYDEQIRCALLLQVLCLHSALGKVSSWGVLRHKHGPGRTVRAACLQQVAAQAVTVRARCPPAGSPVQTAALIKGTEC